MATIPTEELYETDTIFSQEGDVPDHYLEAKLRDVESDNEVLSESENTLINERLFTIDLSSPAKVGSDSFKKLVEENEFIFGSSCQSMPELDDIVFQDELYDITQDTFRYGRQTSGTSYNLVTGKMQEKVLEKIKEKDEDDDHVSETVTEDEKTHRFTTEVKISLNGGGDGGDAVPLYSFESLYDSQMPKFFKYGDIFPEICGIWTLLFDQQHYDDMSTFELQASICAALNSKHHMIICIGVDNFNTITGVELTATDRVVFRMALTRAVAGEFQPPLIKVPPKQLTGVSPMKRDVSEFTSTIDVIFVPVLDGSIGAGDSATPSRFLIVVRVKEITEKLYQLSSGRIYVEEGGRVTELSGIDDAFRYLIINKTPDQKPSFGSFFMLEPEPFIEDSQLELHECSSEEDDNIEIIEDTKLDNIDFGVHQVITPDERRVNTQLSVKLYNGMETLLDRLDSPQVQNIGWLFFASAITYGIYQTIKTRL